MLDRKTRQVLHENIAFGLGILALGSVFMFAFYFSVNDSQTPAQMYEQADRHKAMLPISDRR